MSMNSTSNFSRRQIGQLALGASLSLIATTVVKPVERAFAATKRPAYIKDESGISYYDVKAGTGSGPVDGDFVVIDYVSAAQFVSHLIVATRRASFYSIHI